MGAPRQARTTSRYRWSQRSGRRNITTWSNSGSTRSNSSAGQLLAMTRTPSTDDTQAFVVGAGRSGERSSRPAGPRYSAGQAPVGCGRSPPPSVAQHVVGRGWHHHGRDRGPAALADRAEARIAEAEVRRRSELRSKLASPRSPKEIHSSADRRTAYAESIKTNQHTYPVAAGKDVGTSSKNQCFQVLVMTAVCLRVVLAVGISVGITVSVVRVFGTAS